MKQKVLGLGFPFDSDEKFTVNTTALDQIKSDLNILLLTPLGSRYMMPQFGVNLTQYVFEPLDDDTSSNIIGEINVAIQKYISGVKTNSTSILVDDDNNCIGINIKYIVTDGFVEQSDSLELSF